MKLRTIFFLSITLVAFTGSVAFSEEWSMAQKEVWEVQEAYFEARTKGDKEGFMKYFHKDCILLLSNYSIFLNKPEIKDRFPARIRSPKLKPLVINIFDNNVAILQYIYSLSTFGEDFWGRSTTIWMKKKEGWQIIGGMSADCDRPSSCGWRP